MIASTSASEPVSGFSQITCLPAASAASTCARCRLGGVQMSMMSRLGIVEQVLRTPSVRPAMPNSSPTAFRRADVEVADRGDAEAVGVGHIALDDMRAADAQPDDADGLDAHAARPPGRPRPSPAPSAPVPSRESSAPAASRSRCGRGCRRPAAGRRAGRRRRSRCAGRRCCRRGTGGCRPARPAMSTYLRISIMPSVPVTISRPSPQVGMPSGVNQSTRIMPVARGGRRGACRRRPAAPAGRGWRGWRRGPTAPRPRSRR